MTRIFTVVFCALLLAACASTSDEEANRSLQREPAQELYERAKASMKIKNYADAIKRLEALDNRFPFGPYSQQAQLDLLFAYYKNGDTEDALAAADRFIRQNPRHVNLDYAYYMKGLTNFTAEHGLSREVFSPDFSERDNSSARQSFVDFQELTKLFPDSKYSADARKRMIYLRNKLAEYELHVARYYLSRNSYIGALNRAKYVVEHFPKSTPVPEALGIMMTSYKYLELPELEEKTRRVLKLNYPEFARQFD